MESGLVEQALQIKNENEAAKFIMKYGYVKLSPRQLINAYAENTLVFTVTDTSSYKINDWCDFIRVAVRIDLDFLKHIKLKNIDAFDLYILFTYYHGIIDYVPSDHLMECMPLLEHSVKTSPVDDNTREMSLILQRAKDRLRKDNGKV